MTVSVLQLQDWLNAKEDEHLEFKEAKNSFQFEKLKAENKIRSVGRTKGGRWYPVEATE
jgi:hypothetical protein